MNKNIVTTNIILTLSISIYLYTHWYVFIHAYVIDGASEREIKTFILRVKNSIEQVYLIFGSQILFISATSSTSLFEFGLPISP